MGRPSSYTPELAEAICERLENGESLRAICLDPDLPNRDTVRIWRLGEGGAPHEFSVRYARARKEQAATYAEQVLVESRLALKAKKAHEVQARKLMADNLKWTAGRMDPGTWGDKLDVGIGQSEGREPVKVEIDTDELGTEERVRKVADILARAREVEVEAA